MNGLRAIASWTRSPLSHFGKTGFRFVQLERNPSLILSDDKHISFTVGGNQIAKFRPYSWFTKPSFQRQPRSYWSTLVAGILGVGVTLVYKGYNKDVVSNFLFPTAYCACKDECEERKCDSSDCLRRSDKDDEIIQKANAELEAALKDTKGKAIELTEAALKAYCDAIDALKLAISKVYCAVEEENLASPRFEEVWCDVNQVLIKRCDLAKLAMEKGQCACELLRRLREVIENGRACRYTSCNPLLANAEDTLRCAEKELCSKKGQMEPLLSASRTAEQLRNLVEEFRRDLKAESESLIPADDCRSTLTKNEANMILTHAYKKILRIQQERQRGKNNC